MKRRVSGEAAWSASGNGVAKAAPRPVGPKAASAPKARTRAAAEIAPVISARLAVRGGRLAKRVGTWLGSGGRRLLAAVGRLWVAGRARVLRAPGGGRPITVIDQASAGAKLRLVLVEVDGQRVLVASSGDQVPAMLALAPGAVAVREKRATKTRTGSARPKRMPDRDSFAPTGSTPVWHGQSMQPTKPTGNRGQSSWTPGAAAGSEIQ